MYTLWLTVCTQNSSSQQFNLLILSQVVVCSGLLALCIYLVLVIGLPEQALEIFPVFGIGCGQ